MEVKKEERGSVSLFKQTRALREGDWRKSHGICLLLQFGRYVGARGTAMLIFTSRCASSIRKVLRFAMRDLLSDWKERCSYTHQ